MKQELQNVSRREFLKRSAVVGAGAVAAAGMLSACSTEQNEDVKVASTGSDINWDHEVDIVIVGYGGAGVTAAISAQQAGASFLVLEKDTEARGGNTGCTGGWTIGKDVESGFNYFKSLCRGVTPDEVLRAHVEAFHKFPDFARSIGIEPDYKKYNFVYPSVPGATEFGDGTKDSKASFRCAKPGENTNTTWQRFADAARDMGISVEDGNVLVATPATRLIQDPNTKEVIGVTAMTGVQFDIPSYTWSGGTEINIKANRAVILCCGGYENSPEIRDNFGAHPHGAYVTFYGTPFNQGDGIRMASDVGAKLWHMNKKEVHALANVPATQATGIGIVVDAYEAKGHDDAPATKSSSFFINRFGKRFQNESFYHGHTDRTQAWDRFVHVHGKDDAGIEFADEVGPEFADYINLPFYWIFDQAMFDAGPLISDHEENYRFALQHGLFTAIDNQEWVDNGWVMKADTIEELAAQIVAKDYWGQMVGVDAQALAETLAKFNEYAAAGEDPEFGRPAETMQPLAGPFYAMELCECQTNTDGGPERNEFCQTMNHYGEPIPRLYNCGECGSIWGAMYNGGGNIPETYSTGIMAVEHAMTLEPLS